MKRYKLIPLSFMLTFNPSFIPIATYDNQVDYLEKNTNHTTDTFETRELAFTPGNYLVSTYGNFVSPWPQGQAGPGIYECHAYCVFCTDPGPGSAPGGTSSEPGGTSNGDITVVKWNSGVGNWAGNIPPNCWPNEVPVHAEYIYDSYSGANERMACLEKVYANATTKQPFKDGYTSVTCGEPRYDGIQVPNNPYLDLTPEDKKTMTVATLNVLSGSTLQVTIDGNTTTSPITGYLAIDWEKFELVNGLIDIQNQIIEGDSYQNIQLIFSRADQPTGGSLQPDGKFSFPLANSVWSLSYTKNETKYFTRFSPENHLGDVLKGTMDLVNDTFVMSVDYPGAFVLNLAGDIDNYPPMADFTYNANLSSCEVTLSSVSSDPNNSIAEYQWFRNGRILEGENDPTITVPIRDQDLIELVVRDAEGVFSYPLSQIISATGC